MDMPCGMSHTCGRIRGVSHTDTAILLHRLHSENEKFKNNLRLQKIINQLDQIRFGEVKVLALQLLL